MANTMSIIQSVATWETLGLLRTFAIWCLTATLTFFLSSCFYNVFLHPLKDYPGPLLWRATRLTYVYFNMKGTVTFDIHDLFERYGPIVRIAPDELAYAHPSAWKDINGHNPKGEETGKWIKFYRPVDTQAEDLVSAEREKHGVIRRQLSHGFSEKSMRAQEPVIKGYVDKLIRQLRDRCANGAEAIDMTMAYNFTTFDVIGDLAFGEPFGCLDTFEIHPWIKTMFTLTEMGVMMQSAAHYPWFTKALIACIPKRFASSYVDAEKFAEVQVSKRIEQHKNRPDLLEGLLMKQDEWQMPFNEIVATARILIIAGSETTATTLTAATYLLASNPEKLAKVTHEVRSAFASEDEITIGSAAKLTYMLACLEEALRFYPPAPIGLPRVVPKGGRTFCGQYVPEDTHVAIWQWAANHYSGNFVDPDSFAPERFLEGQNAKYAADRKEAMQPFSFGPRNCIGRNLAYAEMRTILARLIFNFDLQLDPRSKDWMKGQKVFCIWKKPPMMVKLTPRTSK